MTVVEFPHPRRIEWERIAALMERPLLTVSELVDGPLDDINLLGPLVGGDALVDVGERIAAIGEALYRSSAVEVDRAIEALRQILDRLELARQAGA